MKTKTIQYLRLALAGAAALLTHTTSAQTWHTVDDYIDVGGADVYCMTKDPAGNLYAAGDASITGGWDTVATIRKSSNGGATWAVIDAYSKGETYPSYEYVAITADAAGKLYAGGDDGAGIWFVRQSLDSGLTWSTVDQVAGGGARGLAADSAGNVYAVGAVNYSWTVRKSANGGNSWSTVVKFAPGVSGANGVFCHPTAGIFVVGSGYVTSGTGRRATTQTCWYVRRSLNGGATWTTVDTQLGGVAIKGIGADASGSLYVVGENGNYHNWIVRKSSNGGTSWATIDNFLLPNSLTQAYDFTADAHGNLFVVGFTINLSTYAQAWVVREKATGSSSWQTVDTFLDGGIATAAVADSSGAVFVGGWGSDGVYYPAWIVRKN